MSDSDRGERDSERAVEAMEGTWYPQEHGCPNCKTKFPKFDHRFCDNGCLRGVKCSVCGFSTWDGAVTNRGRSMTDHREAPAPTLIEQLEDIAKAAEYDSGAWLRHDTLRRIIAALAERAEPEVILGVGDGFGNLFVRGSWEAIQRVKALISENERLRALEKREEDRIVHTIEVPYWCIKK